MCTVSLNRVLIPALQSPPVAPVDLPFPLFLSILLVPAHETKSRMPTETITISNTFPIAHAKMTSSDAAIARLPSRTDAKPGLVWLPCSRYSWLRAKCNKMGRT